MVENTGASPDQPAGARAPGRVGSPYTHRTLALLLFTLWPLLNFAHQNREQLDAEGLGIVALTFLVSSLAAIIASGVLDLVARRQRRIGATAAVAAFLLLFFNYHIVYDGIAAVFLSLGLPRGENYAYLLLVLAICSGVYLAFRTPFALKMLLVFGILANVLPALGLLWFILARAGDTAVDTNTSVVDVELVRKPNVFHIIADAYARHDSLFETVGYDNESFLHALEQRSFYIARKSYANYPTTFLSIASTVSMDYVVTEKTPPFGDRRQFYTAIQGSNPASRTLRKHGYRFAYLGSAWWDGSKCTSEVDLCLSTSRAVRQTLISMTPLKRFLPKAGRSLVADIKAGLDEILKIQPVYLFAHTLTPHPPRTFTSDCREVSTVRTRNDGISALAFWGDKKGFVQDLECTNEQILALVDAIVDRDPSAVIFLHGDHGTAFDLDWSLPIDEWPDRQIEERFRILMAVRLPEACDSYLYPSLTPVNLYRVLFACLGHFEPRFAPDMLYVSPHEEHPDYGKAHPYWPTAPIDGGNRSSPSVAAAKSRFGAQ